MKLSVGYWITSAVITLAGIGMMIGGGVYRAVNSASVNETLTFSDFKSMQIELEAASLTLKSSPAQTECMVTFVDMPNSPKAYLDDNTLVIEQKQKKAFQLISFGWSAEAGEVIITVPEDDYKKIALSLGVASDSEISGISCNSLELDAGVGNLTIRDLNVEKELNVDGGTGDVTLQNITVGGKCDMDLGTGNLLADNLVTKKQCDFDLGTGDCEFRDCQFDGLELDCGTGDVSLYGIVLKGDADLVQGMGDIILELMGDPMQYSIFSESGMGDVTIDGNDITGLRNVDAEYEIRVECGVGDVEITFPDKD